MNAARLFAHPVAATAILGKTKSFKNNPVLGDPELNREGLHRWRVKTAWEMAQRRRRAMASRLSAADREAFDRDGFIVTENFLPQRLFEQLRAQLLTGEHPAEEMRQGGTVTRTVALTPRLRRAVPAINPVVDDPRFRAQLCYAAGRAGEPAFVIQTVIADRIGLEDPQTVVHADTFHPTAKAWLFLHDVGEDDGPFRYVPGSHRLTPERLEWEYEQSLTASGDAREHHRAGSFRLKDGDLERMQLPQPKKMVVKANTLVTADTFGFHARTPSTRPTVRIEIHGSLRRNPFMPWNGLDPLSLPGLKQNFMRLDLMIRDLERRTKKPVGEQDIRPVGLVPIASPAHV